MDRSTRETVILNKLTDKVTDGYLVNVKNKLASATDQQLMQLEMINLKNPVVAFVLSLFLGVFGVDRFYLGQVGLGLGKLLTCGGLLIWAVVDLFLIMKATKEENNKKVMMIL